MTATTYGLTRFRDDIGRSAHIATPQVRGYDRVTALRMELAMIEAMSGKPAKVVKAKPTSFELVAIRRETIRRMNAEGLRNRDIAAALNLTHATVSTDLKRMGLTSKEGDPRQAHNITRDARILAALAEGPRTTRMLAALLGIAIGDVGNAITRMLKRGDIERGEIIKQRRFYVVAEAAQ